MFESTPEDNLRTEDTFTRIQCGGPDQFPDQADVSEKRFFSFWSDELCTHYTITNLGVCTSSIPTDRGPVCITKLYMHGDSYKMFIITCCNMSVSKW